MLCQLAVKAISYGSSTLILKHCSAGELGIVSMRLELYFIALLFFGREALKNGNSFICCFTNALCGGVPLLLYHLHFGGKEWEGKQLAKAFGLYSVAALLELVSDVARVLVGMEKFRVEMISFVAKHLSLILFILARGRISVLFAFALSQIVSSLVYGALVLAFGVSVEKTVVPLRLSIQQSYLKFLLCNGEAIVCSFFLSSAAEQGTFSLMASYASTISKVVVFPLEETAKAKIAHFNLEKDSLASFESSFNALVVTAASIGCLGFFYSNSLLYLLLGRDSVLSNANLFSLHCFLIYLHSIHSVLNAFGHCRILPRTMQKLLLLCNVAFFSCALSLVHRLGGMAILIANALVLGVKIGFWLFFLTRVKPLKGLKAKQIILPIKFQRFILVFWVSFASKLLLSDGKEFKRNVLHLSIGGLCAAFLAFGPSVSVLPRGPKV